MFYDRSDSDEDVFDLREFNNEIEELSSVSNSAMNVTTVIYIVGSVAVLLLLLGCCCRRKKYRGQVIAIPVVTSYPTQNANTSFPTAMPSPYAGAPYPAAPYPAAPYPAAALYPTHAAPYPPPTAPDAHALPPTYEQAVGGQKDPPYNPNAPH